ncbi:hypothetical protein AbraIFM66950_001451 [Aspergillus brasiliensis]|nr:hypothetical protein AbraIFM66950_001451 [Aspergillus brasiliensis]
MGHKAAGTIAAVGAAVNIVAVGDRVAIEPGHPCRRCSPCKSGTYNLCPAVKFAAAPPDVHSTLTWFWKALEDFVYRLADETVSLEEAVLLEPLAVAVHAVRIAALQPGHTVVIKGCGTIGLLCAAVAPVFGVQRILLLDIAEARVWGRGRHASGNTGIGQPKPRIPMLALSEKELRVFGCFRYGPGDFTLAMTLLSQKSAQLKPLISSITPFEQAPTAWEKTARGEGVKNLIEGVLD